MARRLPMTAPLAPPASDARRPVTARRSAARRATPRSARVRTSPRPVRTPFRGTWPGGAEAAGTLAGSCPAAALTRCWAASNDRSASLRRDGQRLVGEAPQLPVAAVQREDGRAGAARVVDPLQQRDGRVVLGDDEQRLAAARRLQPLQPDAQVRRRVRPAASSAPAWGRAPGGRAEPALVVEVGRQVPRVVAGRADQQQAPRGLGGGPQRAPELLRALQPARGRQHLAQHDDLLGVHGTMVPQRPVRARRFRDVATRLPPPAARLADSAA